MTTDAVETPNHDAGQQETTTDLAMSQIEVSPTFNPRRFKSKAARQRLRDDIERQGILQAVLVRPHPEREGHYELAAGYTRHDIAVELDFDTIPARIKPMSDKEMRDAATAENIHREDMSPIDEGEQAQRMMAEHNNDRETVRRLLGWGESKLKNRIQISRCSDEIAQALVDQRINLAHAEIMSTLREETQKKALELVEKHDLTAPQLEEKVAALAMALDRAPFDKTECQTCFYNSSTQGDMFSGGMEKGRCLNRACFDDKMESFLQGIKESQQENFSRVEFARDMPEGTTTVIEVNGSNGVGEDQFRACQGCEYYGALVKTRPGEAGGLTRHVCFNLECHGKKVREYQELIATDAAPATTAKNAGTSAGKGTGKGGTKSAAKKKAAPASTPQAIVERIHKVRRSAGAEVAANADNIGPALALIALIHETGKMPEDAVKALSHTDQQTLTREGKTLANTSSRTAVLEVLAGLDTATLNQMQVEVGARAMGGAGNTSATDRFGGCAEQLARMNGSDLSRHFTMDKAYLEAHTKPVIQQLLVNSGFAEQYEADNGKGSFKKLMGRKKGEIITAVTESGFDFAGFVPSNMAFDKPEQAADNPADSEAGESASEQAPTDAEKASETA